MSLHVFAPQGWSLTFARSLKADAAVARSKRQMSEHWIDEKRRRVVIIVEKKMEGLNLFQVKKRL